MKHQIIFLLIFSGSFCLGAQTGDSIVLKYPDKSFIKFAIPQMDSVSQVALQSKLNGYVKKNWRKFEKKAVSIALFGISILDHGGEVTPLFVGNSAADALLKFLTMPGPIDESKLSGYIAMLSLPMIRGKEAGKLLQVLSGDELQKFIYDVQSTKINELSIRDHLITRDTDKISDYLNTINISRSWQNWLAANGSRLTDNRLKKLHALEKQFDQLEREYRALQIEEGKLSFIRTALGLLSSGASVYGTHLSSTEMSGLKTSLNSFSSKVSSQLNNLKGAIDAIDLEMRSGAGDILLPEEIKLD